jgi:hypothetical protein
MAVQETPGSADQPQLQAGGGNMERPDNRMPDSRKRGNQIWRGNGTFNRPGGAFIAPPPPAAAKKPDGLVSYEVHFLRADGTLSLRLFTAAATTEEALLSVGKMQSGEFAAVKVWRSLDHAMVHHRPAHAEPAED